MRNSAPVDNFSRTRAPKSEPVVAIGEFIQKFEPFFAARDRILIWSAICISILRKESPMPTKKSQAPRRGKKLSKGKTLKAVKPLLNPQPLPPRHVPLT
jgi:hypothetical protein